MSPLSIGGVKKHFEHSYGVYHEDTDVAGVVYYANYLKFAERARSDSLRDLGVDQSALMNDGLFFVVKRCMIDYIMPAKLGDTIYVKTTFNGVLHTSVKLFQTIKKADKTLATLDILIACVKRTEDGSFLPARIPEPTKVLIMFPVKDGYRDKFKPS